MKERGTFSGFRRQRLPGHGIEVDALVGGPGPPLLLLHGYPQTRMMWKQVAPRLAKHFTVIVPDLRGYGRSDKPPGDDAHTLYSKRTLALDQITTLRALGYSRFAVAGHDRGARVAYRLAMDHPDAVERIAVLDIVPTGEMWTNANASSAMSAFHWYLLAQPKPLPEKLIGSDPDFFLQALLRRWAGDEFHFDPESLEDYSACFRDPACIHATCEDYRAGWGPDREADEADRGKRKIAAPLLVIWGERSGVAKARPVETWRAWASDVRGIGVPAGHFVCEEAPSQVTHALQHFFADTPGTPDTIV